jgi:cytochrome P450
MSAAPTEPTTAAASPDGPRFDPLSPDQLRDPYAIYEALRRDAPVHHVPEFDLWVVSRYDDVRAVLEEPDTFSSAHALISVTHELPDAVHAELARGFPDAGTLTMSDGATHTRLRSLAEVALAPERIAAMAPRIAALTEQLLDGIAAEGSADLVERFAWPLPLAVIADMLSVPDEDLPYLHRWSVDWLRLLQAGEPLERRVAYARSFASLQHYVLQALQARARRPGDDVLGEIIAARNELDPELSMVETMRVPLSLIVIGHVVVTRALANAVHALEARPELIPVLYSEGARRDRLLDELLRVDSPAQGMFRTATREAQVGGVRVPRGARLMILYGSANHDETHFPQPEHIDLDRAGLDAHLAFGAGVHRCVGEPLARAELRIALPIVFARLRGLRLDPERRPERERIFFARGFSHLWVTWDVG